MQREIIYALRSLPWISVPTVALFFAEVRGYSKLYDNIEDSPYGELLPRPRRPFPFILHCSAPISTHFFSILNQRAADTSHAPPPELAASTEAISQLQSIPALSYALGILSAHAQRQPKPYLRVKNANGMQALS